MKRGERSSGLCIPLTGALSNSKTQILILTIYSFSAALLGLPMLMKDHDIHTEDPSDVDDENVTERGFQPILPGESTRLSSALALFRASRIMSRVLGEIYPAALSHELSLHRISALNDELDAWQCSLAPHLRLQFAQDKPSTSVTSSRSPLLVCQPASLSVDALLTFYSLSHTTTSVP